MQHEQGFVIFPVFTLYIVCVFSVKVSEFGCKLIFTNWKNNWVKGDWSFVVTFWCLICIYLFNLRCIFPNAVTASIMFSALQSVSITACVTCIVGVFV
jgi:hypothetical protein